MTPIPTISYLFVIIIVMKGGINTKKRAKETKNEGISKRRQYTRNIVLILEIILFMWGIYLIMVKKDYFNRPMFPMLMGLAMVDEIFEKKIYIERVYIKKFFKKIKMKIVKGK